MTCPVCGKEYSFFRSHWGAYCSSECAEAAVKELEELLEKMEKEEDKKDPQQ